LLFLLHLITIGHALGGTGSISPGWVLAMLSNMLGEVAAMAHADRL